MIPGLMDKRTTDLVVKAWEAVFDLLVRAVEASERSAEAAERSAAALERLSFVASDSTTKSNRG